MRPKARWIGIDEAGYGPNLGPLVMTAVVAESADDRPPDLWRDLALKVQRARGAKASLWIDDSKAIYKAGQGRARLEAACLALIESLGKPMPESLEGFVQALGGGALAEIELERWRVDGMAREFPGPLTRSQWELARALRPLESPLWRIAGVQAVAVGPSAFNAGLEAPGANKATVHFAAFRRLLDFAWNLAGDGVVTRIQGDKHGGRHFYYDHLRDALPDSWIDRGVETPALSQYVIRIPGRRLEVAIKPKADAGDGLVALASIVSKTIRELWMDVFNDFWAKQSPGIKRTAGYPVDASRFRAEIEERAASLGLDPSLWWRNR